MTTLSFEPAGQDSATARSEAHKLGKFLPGLGVYGFDDFEIAILAALVTEDPLLLIGRSGTGKTYLLNSLSEALALEHRHYNASLISFDDLVGFPFPEQEQGTVRFLETPATVWPAESVLIDEISRCKPEHQNRLFALVHERRIQGIALSNLRFRWAAMNPPSGDQGGDDDYLGSEPLDPALADRFSLFVEAADWERLSEQERRAIATPAGEGRIADDDGVLADALKRWRHAFVAQLERCPSHLLDYVTAVTNHLVVAGIRISPRRTRLLARSLLAAGIIIGDVREDIYLTILRCSLPHKAWGQQPPFEIVQAAHRAAWDTASSTQAAWVHAFLSEPSIARKVEILLDRCPSADAGTQAVAQLLASERKDRATAFAYVTYPAASAGHLPIGAEGVNDLARIAGPILEVDGHLEWSQPHGTSTIQPAELTRVARHLQTLSGSRLSRARQFFYHCLVERVPVERPERFEEDIKDAIELIRARVQP
ncbi:AAA family ATPase [Novosphingobium flavum]|uniref:AAA family ATPase n=1 Tax=Novosphingobium aerophilum TaxID=2839843 RepID=UPI00163AE39B|nr:MoxR family ATPase [Novosphingobium aerophilum]MBC2663780.1 AAA family ATPase [Novosphingobium aerophilum]